MGHECLSDTFFGGLSGFISCFFYINQRISTYLDFFSFRMVANMEKWRDEWVADVKPSDEELAPKNADITKLLGCRVYGGLRLRNGRAPRNDLVCNVEHIYIYII